VSSIALLVHQPCRFVIPLTAFPSRKLLLLLSHLLTSTQAICHCHTCRKVSGTTFTTNLAVPAAAFNVTGKEHLKDYAATHETGMILTLNFCTNCGTMVYKEADSEMFKGVMLVQAGTLDGAEMGLGDVKLGAELYVKQRVGWLKGLDGVAQLQEFS
jgi:hypothetical protein